ncbi:MAG: hypothetical protein AAFP86_07065, partial [Planctomycetota bacterium]
QTVGFLPFPAPSDVVPYTFGGTDGFLATISWPPTVAFLDASDLTHQTTLWTTSAAASGHFFGKIATRRNGNILAAAYSQPPAIYELDTTGTLIRIVDLSALSSITALRDVHELENGNLLLGGQDGVFLLDEPTQTVTQLVPGVILRSFDEVRSDLGVRYCTALPNSLGVQGGMSASGMRTASLNDVELTARGLPPLQFGIFVASRTQGFQMVPNGGNLCLGGQIGRYQQLDQISQVDGGGRGRLRIDLTAVPQPAGTVAVQPGESWSFQGWYRDVGASGATSNFTDGLEIAFQ